MYRILIVEDDDTIASIMGTSLINGAVRPDCIRLQGCFQ